MAIVNSYVKWPEGNMLFEIKMLVEDEGGNFWLT